MIVSIVVSDSSPIRALSHLGLLDLLPQVFGEVLIPPAVAQELADTTSHFAPFDAARSKVLTIRQPHDQQRVRALLKVLHQGESEAIALAVEVNASAILMDEMAGRSVAKSEGLTPIGVAGVLIAFKRQKLIPSVVPLLDRLIKDINFFVSPTLRAETARLAGESLP